MSMTLETLGRQHQEVLAKLAQAERAICDHDDAQIPELAAFLECDVAHHLALEEQGLFRIMARHLSLVHGPLAVMNAEHAALRELEARLARALRADDVERQRGSVREIIELLRAHIAKEDRVLFPMAARMLSAAELQEVDGLSAALGGAAVVEHAR